MNNEFPIFSFFRQILYFSAILNEFWHFRTHLWNSEKFSSKFRSKIAVVMSKLRKFEWIEFSFTKVYQNYDDFWVKFLYLSGAKVCTSCRSRRELPNEYLVAKIGVDTAENEPVKVVWFSSYGINLHRPSPSRPPPPKLRRLDMDKYGTWLYSWAAQNTIQ